ncbi:hypothetical protein SAMN05444392_12330 [Seinonella peptonophila]|uniref:Coproporphyrinogen III oxidase n=1 Tax=Seinonella peptonophila TaxID=112248 RepID=A0A1M5BGP1_9BACL|nr:hypothetical protein [Seinonella peptonophila]SHF41621.1 hypothetical protein SAMN05444392_12330 [Seinonella peptonophila]
MSNWYVMGLDSIFHRDVELILRLFFAQAKVLHTSEDAIGKLVFHLKFDHDQVVVKVDCSLLEQSLKSIGEAKGVILNHQSEKEQRKQLKQVINHALLQALEKITSIQQPWGILTGVRPTKLYHRLLQKDLDDSTIKERLAKDYRILPEKMSLLQEIVTRQHAALPDLYQLRNEVSLYIGIPFCPTKCAYCTFPAYSIRGRNGSVEAFLEGLHQEIRAIGKWLTDHQCKVTTLYFGGGTPTWT